jgi:DNA mismatch repair protein MutL
MQNKIHLLPDDLINKIAAGEVVERPASIVKELLENSVDSGATKIELTLEKSGLEEITVSDNGAGMNKLEVENAFVQHTTSKIKSIEDLFNISTLGFRGEALASISSISSVKVHTYNGIDKPVLFTIQDKESFSTIGQGRNIGTTITVKNIFQNIPVRRKFLKTEETEYRYIAETFISIALSKPSIGFGLVKNGKVIYQLQPSNSFLKRVTDIFKTLTKEKLIPLEFDNTSMQIHGLLGHPDLAKSINTYQYIFINSRFVRTPLINKAVKEGFATTIMKDLEPVYFLFFSLKNDELDVNVHPRKLEVRFNNPGQIYNNTKNIISKTLEMFSQRVFKEQFNPNQQVRGFDVTKNTRRLSGFMEQRIPPEQASAIRNATKTDVKSGLNFTKNILKDTLDIEQNFLINSKTEKFNKATQIFDTYIIFEREDKLLLIDQHAAHERINFEKYLQIIDSEKNLVSQSLLIPIDIPITQDTKEKIFENETFIKKLGFDFNIIGNTLLITQIPNLIPLENVEIIFKNLIAELETSLGQGSNKWTDTKSKLIATIACHSSIRAGQKLDGFAISGLVSDLFNCKLPYSCPHGRPFYWEISKEEIEKKFKRIT